MTDTEPIACSLTANQLPSRLEEIAAIGASSLIAREGEAGSHTLRFHPSEETKMRLEGIVAAERRCCPFLELALHQRGEELVLTIGAPADGQAVADQLAAAFAP